MADMCGGLYRETFGDGPELVLVHGWAMHGGVWRDFARNFDGFRITLVDLPGHGRSEPMENWCLEEVTARLAGLTERPAVWLGWSLGATLVLNLAVRFPQKVDKLVLVAGNARFVAHERWPGMEPTLLEKFALELRRDPEATLTRFLALQARGETSPREVLRRLRQSLEKSAMPDSTTLGAALEVLRTADLVDELAELSCPGLLLHGACDELVPVAAGPAMERLWPRARVRIFDGAAHAPFLSRAEETAAAVVEFLERPESI